MNGMSGMVSVVKRPALIDSKSGIPMYHSMTAETYQQAYQQAATLAAMQQQPYMQYTCNIMAFTILCRFQSFALQFL